jgi:hypothetical protein
MAKSRKPAPSTEEAIGKICMAWSALEHLLAAILAELLETDHATAIITSAALDFRHRRDLITSLAEFKVSETAAFEELKKFMAQVGGMAKERNEAVHALWYRADTGRDQRILMRNRGIFTLEMKPLSARHLMTVARKIALLAAEGSQVRQQIGAAVKAWRKTQPSSYRPLVTGEQLRARLGIPKQA